MYKEERKLLEELITEERKVDGIWEKWKKWSMRKGEKNKQVKSKI